MLSLIDKLYEQRSLERDEYIMLIDYFKQLTGTMDQDPVYQKLSALAVETAKKHFSNRIYTRGLIEFSNYCKNDCYYCGIRKSNGQASRYRLTPEEIMECCEEGYRLGFRTFVLQSGEDGYFSDERLVSIISDIRQTYPDCAITLSIGEKSFDSYASYYKAGANRFLLRHETADSEHYRKLHPESMSLENRKNCLFQLKQLGYQVGTGFMVGSPYQTSVNLADDLLFIGEFQPHMVGIGPYIVSQDTPFSEFKSGSVNVTLALISIIRLILPKALIPATTALGTLDPMGREKGVLSGANVVMPNLSPVSVRKKYSLYDNKICTGDEAAECKFCLANRMKKIGYEIVEDRGDFQ